MMKLVVVAALALSLSALAQEPSNASAKQAFAALNKSLDKLKTLDPVKSGNAYKAELAKAQKKLEAIKEKEPGFDVSALEQALKAFEATLAQGQEEKAAAKDARAREVAAKQAADEAARDAALEARAAKGAEVTGPRREPEADAAPAPPKAEPTPGAPTPKVKLAAAVRKDASVEALFRTAFAAEGWNEEILQVNLLDTDWHVEKNKVTGAIVCRYQSAAIKAKNKAGKCIAYELSMKQDWNGSGFSATPRRYGHNAQDMACDD